MARNWDYVNVDKILLDELNESIKDDAEMKKLRITKAQHFFEHKAREYLDQRKKK